jgi:4-hydroxy-tetrahydrodipicolinate synthase
LCRSTVAIECGSDAGFGAPEDHDAAKAIYEDLSPLLRFIVAGGLPTTVKAGLNLLGTHVGDPRPPLLPLDEAGLDEIRALLID